MLLSIGTGSYSVKNDVQTKKVSCIAQTATPPTTHTFLQFKQRNLQFIPVITIYGNLSQLNRMKVTQNLFGFMKIRPVCRKFNDEVA